MLKVICFWQHACSFRPILFQRSENSKVTLLFNNASSKWFRTLKDVIRIVCHGYEFKNISWWNSRLTYQIHSMELIKFIHHLNEQWTRILWRCLQVCMFKKFWRKSRENQRNNFSLQVEDFLRSKNRWEKCFQLTIVAQTFDENKERSGAILSMLTYPHKKVSCSYKTLSHLLFRR